MGDSGGGWLRRVRAWPLADLHTQFVWEPLTPEAVSGGLRPMDPEGPPMQYVQQHNLADIVMIYHGALQLVAAQEAGDESGFLAWAKACVPEDDPLPNAVTMQALLARWELMAAFRPLRATWTARLAAGLFLVEPRPGYDGQDELQTALLLSLSSEETPWWPELLRLMGDALQAWSVYYACRTREVLAVTKMVSSVGVIATEVSEHDVEATTQWVFAVLHQWYDRADACVVPVVWPLLRALDYSSRRGGPLFQCILQLVHAWDVHQNSVPNRPPHEALADLQDAWQPPSSLQDPVEAMTMVLQTVAIFRACNRLLPRQKDKQRPPALVFPHRWVRAQLASDATVTRQSIANQNLWLVADAVVAIIALQVFFEQLQQPMEVQQLQETLALLFERVVGPFIASADVPARRELQSTLLVYMAQAPTDVNIVPLLRCLVTEQAPEGVLGSQDVMGPQQVSFLVTAIPELQSLPLVPAPNLRAQADALWALRAPNCAGTPLKAAASFTVWLHSTPQMGALSGSAAMYEPFPAGAGAGVMPPPPPPPSPAGLTLQVDVTGTDVCEHLAALRGAIQGLQLKEGDGAKGPVRVDGGQLAALLPALRSVETFLGAQRKWATVPLDTVAPLALDEYQVSGYEPGDVLTFEQFQWLATLCPKTADVYRRSATALPLIAESMEKELLERGITLKLNPNLAKPSAKQQAAGSAGDPNNFQDTYELWEALTPIMEAVTPGSRLPRPTAAQARVLALVQEVPPLVGPGTIRGNELKVAALVWDHMPFDARVPTVQQYIADLEQSKEAFVQRAVLTAATEQERQDLQRQWDVMPTDAKKTLVDSQQEVPSKAKRLFMQKGLQESEESQRAKQRAVEEWEAMAPEARREFAITYIADVIAETCSTLEAVGPLKGDAKATQTERSNCTDRATQEVYKNLFGTVALAMPGFAQRAALYAQCAKFGADHKVALNTILDGLVAKAAEDAGAARTKRFIFADASHLATFVDVVGQYFLHFPPGQTPSKQDVTTWKGTVPSLRLKAYDEAVELVQGIRAYVRGDASAGGLLRLYVLWRVHRETKAEGQPTTLDAFTDEQIEAMLSGVVISPDILPVRAVQAAWKAKKPLAIAVALPALDLWLVDFLGRHLEDQGPFDNANNFVNFVQTRGVKSSDLRQVPKPLGPDTALQVRVELELVPLMPWTGRPVDDAVKVLKRRRFAKLVLATEEGSAVTLPMHSFAKAWAIAADKCTKAAKGMVEPEAATQLAECLGAVRKASQKSQEGLGVPKAVQAAFLGNATADAEPRPTTITFTVTARDTFAATVALRAADAAAAAPVAKPPDATSTRGAAASGGAELSPEDYKDMEKYKKLRSMFGDKGEEMAVQQMRVQGKSEAFVQAFRNGGASAPAAPAAPDSGQADTGRAGAGTGAAADVPAPPPSRTPADVRSTTSYGIKTQKYATMIKRGQALDAVLAQMRDADVDDDIITAFADQHSTRRGGRRQHARTALGKVFIRTRLYA
jgi:hypothetical protein